VGTNKSVFDPTHNTGNEQTTAGQAFDSSDISQPMPEKSGLEKRKFSVSDIDQPIIKDLKLSPREKEVLTLSLQGLTNNKIARQLGITEATVKVYLMSVYGKLSVANPEEFAAQAWKITADEITGCMSGYLSPRVLETIQGITFGQQNNQIAITLGITEDTVKVHAKSVFRKLGCSRREEAANIVRRQVLAARETILTQTREIIDHEPEAGKRFSISDIDGPIIESIGHKLLPEEKEVLALALQGLPNNKTARQLGITGATVKACVKAVYRKLSVANPEEFAAQAWKITADEITSCMSGYLSPREREIVQGITFGQSNKQIAITLGITEDTVKVHAKSLFQKLGCSLREEAANIVRGLVLAARETAQRPSTNGVHVGNGAELSPQLSTPAHPASLPQDANLLSAAR
jgi:DNA-binding NarL/FixJ family response regulator